MIPATAAAAAKAVAKAAKAKAKGKAKEGAMHGPAAAADGVALSAPPADGKGGIERHLDSVFTSAHVVSRVGEPGGNSTSKPKPKLQRRSSPYGAGPSDNSDYYPSEERMARAAEIAVAALEQQAHDADMAAAGPAPNPTPAPKPEPAPEPYSSEELAHPPSSSVPKPRPAQAPEPSNYSEAVTIAGELAVRWPVVCEACRARSTPAPKPAPTPPTRVHTQDLEDTQGEMDMMDNETLVMAGDTQGVEDLDGMEDTQGV